MTRDSCFYCGADEPGWVQIQRLFGLKACDLHEAVAIRDCRAYLHEKKMVRFADAYRHPILGKFLLMLKDVSFPVLRSSGELQSCWTLNDKTCDMDTCIAYNANDGDWSIPVKRFVEGEGTITKYTPIFNLKMANMFSADLIDETVFCLVDGVYTKEYEKVQALLRGEKPVTLPEHPDMVEVMYEGREVRVFMPSSDSGAAASAAAEASAENPC